MCRFFTFVQNDKLLRDIALPLFGASLAFITRGCGNRGLQHQPFYCAGFRVADSGVHLQRLAYPLWLGYKRLFAKPGIRR